MMTKKTRPTDTPDYFYWAKMDSWDIEEAILLLKGIDPNQAEAEYMPVSQSAGSWPELLDKKFGMQLGPGNSWEEPKNSKIRDLITRAIQSGHLKEPFAPADFVTWATAKELKIPDELKAAIAQASAVQAAGIIPYEQLVTENRKLTEEIAMQKELITQLEDKLKKSPRQKHVNSLLVMLNAIARDAYKHGESKPKTSPVTKIKNAVHSCGLTVSDGAIRDNLKLSDQLIAQKIEDLE